MGTVLLNHGEVTGFVLKTDVLNIDAATFERLCAQNADLHLERTGNGELIIMAPAGGETGSRNFNIALELGFWARVDGSGVGFDSSTGFVLPNGSQYSPDAAWVRRSRLSVLTARQKQGFLPLCPDFVVELRSPSDTLKMLQDKMEEYRDNGALLGFLIDPIQQNVHVYRPNVATEILVAPQSVSGDPELPGFTLQMARIWNPGF